MERKNLAIIAVAVVAVLVCAALAFTMLGNGQYHTISLTESGTTIEVPDNMVVKSNDTTFGFLVLKNDNTVVISFNSGNQALSKLIGGIDIEKTIFGNNTSRNVTLKDPSVAGYTLKGEYNAVYAGNNQTNDNIIVIGKDTDVVSHIINSIEWH